MLWVVELWKTKLVWAKGRLFICYNCTRHVYTWYAEILMYGFINNKSIIEKGDTRTNNVVRVRNIMKKKIVE